MMFDHSTWARVIAVPLIFSVSWVGASHAQTFDIHAPESKVGEVELESLNAANVGSLTGLNDPTRDSHELIASYGVAAFLKVELSALIQQPAGDEFQVSRMALENIFVLRAAEKAGLGLGWFTSFGAATDPTTRIIGSGHRSEHASTWVRSPLAGA